MAKPKARKDRWKTRWSVTSFTDSGKDYTVALDWNGNYGCSCGAWKFQRAKLPGGHCKHISVIIHASDAKQAALMISTQELPPITLADWTIRVLEDLSAPTEKTQYVNLVMQNHFGSDYDE
jgi:hypothetical protein